MQTQMFCFALFNLVKAATIMYKNLFIIPNTTQPELSILCLSQGAQQLTGDDGSYLPK